MSRTALAPLPISDARAPACAPVRRRLANVVYSVGGRAVQAVCHGVVLACITRLGDGALAADYLWAMAVVAPALMLANLELRSVLSTETSGRFEFREFWTLRLITTALVVIAGVGFAAFSSLERQRTLLVMVVLYKSAESIEDIFIGYYFQHELTSRVATTLCVRGVATAVCVAIGLSLFDSLVVGMLLALILHAVWWGAFGAWYVLRSTSLRIGISREHATSLLRIAAPLGAMAALGSLAVNAPRYALEHFCDPMALAGFGCCASFLQVFTMIGVSAQYTVSPGLARAGAESPRAMQSMIFRYLVVIACFGAAAVLVCHLVGARLLAAVYGEAYATYSDVLAWLMVAGAFFAARGFVATGLTALRCTVSQAAVATATLAFSCVASWFLAPKYGALAGAWVLLGAAVVSFVLHLLYLARKVAECAETSP